MLSCLQVLFGSCLGQTHPPHLTLTLLLGKVTVDLPKRNQVVLSSDLCCSGCSNKPVPHSFLETLPTLGLLGNTCPLFLLPPACSFAQCSLSRILLSFVLFLENVRYLRSGFWSVSFTVISPAPSPE